MNDKQQLFAMRATIVIFTAMVLAYAVAMKGTSIYDLVSSAYQVTLVGAFVPLVMGLYWKRSTTQGAIVSVTAGIAVWILFFPQVGGEALAKAFPAQLAGLLAAFAGMVVGSLVPQKLRNRHEHVHHVQGMPATPLGRPGPGGPARAWKRPSVYNLRLCIPDPDKPMPIYAYKCGSCGHAKDVLQKISDAPLTVCPACGVDSFTKQVTAAGFQLKGSGWYATDFRNGSSAPAPPTRLPTPPSRPRPPSRDGAKPAEPPSPTARPPPRPVGAPAASAGH
jgi:putative FmdB family regulatory protein